ncbi:MAG: DUF2088 domain-containing protein [Deltaproteobacteria bacterium]|nr:DUF2088 domain-containing protein [Candidatus Zymogenaceae bacterium]
MKVNLPELLWYGNRTLTIDLPDDWDVTLHPMRGAESPPLSTDDMRRALTSPCGSPRLLDLARGKRTAVIVFDDITRPTRVGEIAPLVIEELIAGGIDEGEITFVCALGNHGAHTSHEFRKKLSPDILERFRVFNHNAYEHCVLKGETSRGTKVLINREVAEADLVVGIGCVTAHANTGFSGGGKIMLPGVSHIDSAAHYHIQVHGIAPETCGLGRFDGNVMEADIREAARLAGLDFKVDVLVNGRGETAVFFCGDVLAQHDKAVEQAKSFYALDPAPEDRDVIISNAFIKANELFIAVALGDQALRGRPGTVVVVANAPEGQIPHYFQRSFGRNYGGRHYPIARIREGLDVILVAPHYDRTFTDWIENREVVKRVASWEEARRLLEASHGSGTRVGVIPNGTISYIDAGV